MTRSRLLLTLIAAWAALATAAVRAEEAGSAPEAKSVEERLDLLEVKQGDAVVKGDIPGSFRIPGTDISLRLYGYAEVNWVHDFKGDNSDNDYATFAYYMPLNEGENAERTNRDYITMRESRIGLESGMPTKYGVLQVKLEGDFNNEPRNGNSSVYGKPGNVYTQMATNSYGFRVRHAYGQFGGLLVGQTWSTFMDADNFPETVDYNGPPGGTFIRQPQIRYTYATPSAGNFIVALENSSSYVLDPGADAPYASSLSRMPDLVVRWDKGFSWGGMSVRGVTQELRIKDDADLDATKRGFGAAASALVKFRGGADFATLGVTYGEGVGRYLNYSEGAVYDAASDSIKLERAIGAYVGYQYKASDLIRVNLAYGLVHEFDNDFTKVIRDAGLDSGRWGLNRTVQQAHAGFFVSPVKATDFGVEAIWANRRTLSGEKGDGFRANLLARYYINY